MSALAHWLAASRPKTLPAAVVPVAVGVSLSWKLDGRIDGILAMCTLASATAIQIATNLFNDAIDFRKGADTGARLGPKRVTQAGAIPARTVLIAGVLMGALAALLALPMIAARGWPVIAIGIPSLYFAFGYTGGPLPLAYRGLGEVFVVLFFGLVAVAGTVFVQTGEWRAEALLAGIQVGMLSTVLISVNNLRDMAGDGASGKRTLAVRFGAGFARREITLLCLLPHLAGCGWMFFGGWLQAWLFPLAAVIPGFVVHRGVWRHAPGRIFNRFLGIAALQLVAFASGFIAACVDRGA